MLYTKFAFKALAVLSAGILSASAYSQEIAPPKCDYGEPHPNAPEEISQFAFLVGDYKVYLHAWRNEQWSPPLPGATARWNGWYGLGGMAIVDEWYNPDPAQDANAPRGVNVRMYDSEAEEWDMMWISTRENEVQDLRAKVKDGKLTMWQEYPERDNFYAEFIVEGENNWSRIAFTKNDSGDWVEQFKLSAERIPCAAAD